MNRRFDNDDFESFLRYNANQYPMYPSDRVWKGVHATLHTYRKWYAFTALGSLLLLGGFTALFFLNTNSKTQPIANNLVPTSVNKQLNNINNKNSSIDFTPVTKILVAEKITNNNPVKSILVAIKKPVNTAVENSTETAQEIIDAPVKDRNLIISNLEEKQLLLGFQQKMIVVNPQFEINTANSIENKTTSTEKINEKLFSVANQATSIQKNKKQKRFNTQLYFIPTVSYRKLSENNNATIAYQGFGYQQTINVKKVVIHKPDLGFEFGIGGRYRVKNNFYFSTGLQFNLTRYDIRASYHPTEIATVALNRGYRTDSIASLSNFRNVRGGFSNWIENFYFQAALPIGMEVVLATKNKIQWGLQGSLQPTYVIGDRAYLISSDYKNYAKFPNLMRRWNLSSSIGTFVAYTSGKIDWQFGPMLRYQHLSSFTSKYPVKENLFDVGFKVAATFNKK